MNPPSSLNVKTASASFLKSLPWENSKGLVKFEDDKGLTQGFFIGAKSLEKLEDVLDQLEAQTPEFKKEMEESIASGRVSAEEIEKEVGLR